MIDYDTIVKTIEIFTNKSSWPWCRPHEPRRTLQFAGPQPPFRPIGRRSVRADMHGRMASLLRLGGCGRCCSTIRACAVMQRLAHGWRCSGRHARLIATTRRLACASDCPLPNDTLLAVWINAQAKSSEVNYWDGGVFEIWNAGYITLVATLLLRLLDLRPHENMVDN